ncbi:MAG: CRISPR-associated helicase Cas3' [Candidatus Omnitrophota bacterium]
MGREAGVSVETHCKIVGHVALRLMKRMPEWLRDSLFPKGSELIAAAHDIGKVSPTFQEKIFCDLGIRRNLIDPALDKTIGYHFTVSQATAKNYPKYIPEILGKHHGVAPQNVNDSDAQVYGGKKWQEQRIDLLGKLKKELNSEWPVIINSLHSDVLAGLTVVSDWIGSGSLFDYAGQTEWKEKINKALDNAGFITPEISKGLSFKDIFNFVPRDIQTRLYQAVEDRGVYVLEAPMGLGKTEAALYSAYRVLEKKRATGIYFALPTQLTSDKVYLRMEQFLDKILSARSKHQKALLLHGAAWIRNTELGEDGSPGKSWFNNAKRGLLAPFAVGTVDQALMAVMNVKHGFVRTFGLAGKIVILDEVHSYDGYTGTILKELVAALRELCCTVIILSATLTDRERYSIMGVDVGQEKVKQVSEYPLISLYSDKGVTEVSTEKIPDVSVDIRMIDNDLEAIEEILKRAERKEQVLWIENTVKKAQNMFCKSSARATEINIECGLIHSRFIKKDREKNEEKWVQIFGKDGRNLRNEKGRILVGTQVLEQSLDIDADFLVTRICPTDMLFQRIGRLWRHRENDALRPAEAKREAWILSPRLEDAVKNEKTLDDSAKVYSPYVLCRTLEVVRDINSICIPDNIRTLLEKTYQERTEKGKMAEYKIAMEKKREILRSLALVSTSRATKTQPESKAQTRYSEMESAEVLLIQKKNLMDNGVRVKFLDGTEIDLPKRVDPKTWRKLSAELLRNTVMVPEHLAPKAKTKQLSWLKEYVYLGDNAESPFRAAVVAKSAELQSVEDAEIYGFSYDSYLGYKMVKT